MDPIDYHATPPPPWLPRPASSSNAARHINETPWHETIEKCNTVELSRDGRRPPLPLGMGRQRCRGGSGPRPRLRPPGCDAPPSSGHARPFLRDRIRRGPPKVEIFLWCCSLSIIIPLAMKSLTWARWWGSCFDCKASLIFVRSPTLTPVVDNCKSGSEGNEELDLVDLD